MCPAAACHQVFICSLSQGFPGSSVVKDPPAKQEMRCGFSPWVGKIPWRRECQRPPVSLPGNPVDRGAWRAVVHRAAESRTLLSTSTTFSTNDVYLRTWCILIWITLRTIHILMKILPPTPAFDICCSVAQSRLTLCDPMDCSIPGLPVLHYLPELVQTHVHWVGDAIQPSYPLSSPSPPALNLSQHQDTVRGLFWGGRCWGEWAGKTPNSIYAPFLR